MKTTWIITSAIHTNAGIFDTRARILQTHATIDSIQARFPDAWLVLAEGGKEPSSDDDAFAALRERCHVFVDARQNDQIRCLHQDVFDRTGRTDGGGLSGVAKSLAELTLMASVLDVLLREPSAADLLRVDRIFKISGRYQVSPLFDPAAYRNAGDSYVFAKRERSWIENAKELIGVDHYFNSRLWSFAPSRLRDTFDTYQRMIREILDIVAANGAAYTDVEHLLFKFFAIPDVLELDYMHVMGTLAPSGVVVYD